MVRRPSLLLNMMIEGHPHYECWDRLMYLLQGRRYASANLANFAGWCYSEVGPKSGVFADHAKQTVANTWSIRRQRWRGSIIGGIILCMVLSRPLYMARIPSLFTLLLERGFNTFLINSSMMWIYFKVLVNWCIHGCTIHTKEIHMQERLSMMGLTEEPFPP